MNQQRIYWEEMLTTRRDARYVDFYLARTEVTDRCLKAFLAIAASTSIGGWIIFQKYAFIWASIVAASQVLQAVKEYLPYKTRLKALATLSQDLNSISFAAENHWYKVSSGSLYDDDVHDLRFELKQRKMAAVQKAFPASGLPEHKKLAAKAEREAVNYFEIYNAGDNP